jgi:hypothetical protein
MDFGQERYHAWCGVRSLADGTGARPLRRSAERIRQGRGVGFPRAWRFHVRTVVPPSNTLCTFRRQQSSDDRNAATSLDGSGILIGSRILGAAQLVWVIQTLMRVGVVGRVNEGEGVAVNGAMLTLVSCPSHTARRSGMDAHASMASPSHIARRRPRSHHRGSQLASSRVRSLHSADTTTPTRFEHVRDVWRLHRPQGPLAILTAAISPSSSRCSQPV